MEKDLQKRCKNVIKELKKIYGEPETMLNYTTPFELMIAVVLSAQCTDKRVNIVTEKMFKLYNTPKEYAEIDIEELEDLVKTTGFYKNKAKHIKNGSQKLLDLYNGEIPNTIEELIKIDGVGRKSANVILGHIFNRNDGVVVDTHVKRLSKRIGFTKSDNPTLVEKDLMIILEEKDRFLLSNLFIMHGRNICKARRPICNECRIIKNCEMGSEMYGY